MLSLKRSEIGSIHCVKNTYHIGNENLDIEKMDGDYDTFNRIKTQQTTSYLTTLLHLLASSLNPAILNLPFTFAKTGYIIGFVGSLTIIFLYLYCVRTILIVERTLCKRLKVLQMSYTETIYYAFKTGPTSFQKFANFSQYIVDGTFIITWIGANSVLVLLASKNLKTLLDYFYHTDITLRIIIMFIFVPLVILCFIPNLKYLLPCSIFANAINVGCIFIILYFVTEDFSPSTNLKNYGDPSSFPLFVSTILFTINITGIVMPLKNEMRNPKKFSSKFGVLNVFYISFAILYSAFGLICYLKYGDDVKESVILNLPETLWSKILIGMYGIGICFFFPLNSYVPAGIIWDWLTRSYRLVPMYFFLVQTSIAVFTILIASAVPNIVLFLSITGTLGTAIDTMIFPAVAELLINANDRRFFFWVKNCTIIFLGFALIVIGTNHGIYQFIKLFS